MKTSLNFQQMILALEEYWAEQGCLLWHPYHEAVGAGTGNPATLMRVLGPEPWNVAYVEPSFRPDDGRFGDNPYRLQMHHQFQVILKPIPEDAQQLYVKSLSRLGISRREHDIRFVEDNWESPALGAWGLGWEIWIDGMEISQYTYFQQAGGQELNPPACELTYGLDRLAMYLQGVDNVWDIDWDGQHTYGDLLRSQEIEYCVYEFRAADVRRLKRMFELFEEEARAGFERRLVIPAYDYILRCSHTFNILDSRGAISVAERANYFGRMRDMTRQAAQLYLEQRAEAGYPLMHLMPSRPIGTLPEMPEPRTEPTDLLLEIGTEELPASEIGSLVQQLEESIPLLFTEARLAAGESRVFATPRRLAVLVHNVAPRQEDLVRQIRGPRRTVIEKNPRALDGFLRKIGGTEEELIYTEIGGVEYAAYVQHSPGRPAAEVLAELLPGFIGNIKSARGMRWLAAAQVGDTSSTTFARPIRSLLCLLGPDVVPFHYAGLPTGRLTSNGRYDPPEHISIDTPDVYESELESRGIVADLDRRKEEIRRQVIAVASRASGVVKLNEELLDQVTNLVECPTAFVGKIDEVFLSLPEALLTIAVEKHQRYFPVVADNGVLLPAFVAVRNGTADGIESVRHGNERVLRGRLMDAKFFFDRDREHTLEDLRSRLKDMVFHAKLGSMHAKTERLRELIPVVARLVPALELNQVGLDRAAALSKVDLASQVVTEMSNLQGVIGRIYAEAAGESTAVAVALEEQYMPVHPGAPVPQTGLGLLLSIVDRLDNLVGLFAIGIRPSGTADPYGLRRDANGLLACLLATDCNLSLTAAIIATAETMPVEVDEPTKDEIREFILRRFEVALEDQGYSKDIARAILARAGDRPARAVRLVRELAGLREETAFQDCAVTWSRCARLLRQAVAKGETVPRNVEPQLFSSETEQALWEALLHAQTAIGKDHDPQLTEVVSAMAEVNPRVSDFFDAVMVMSDDPAIRRNRLALLAGILRLVDDLLDVSQLEGV